MEPRSRPRSEPSVYESAGSTRRRHGSSTSGARTSTHEAASGDPAFALAAMLARPDTSARLLMASTGAVPFNHTGVWSCLDHLPRWGGLALRTLAAPRVSAPQGRASRRGHQDGAQPQEITIAEYIPVGARARVARGEGAQLHSAALHTLAPHAAILRIDGKDHECLRPGSQMIAVFPCDEHVVAVRSSVEFVKLTAGGQLIYGMRFESPLDAPATGADLAARSTRRLRRAA